MKAAIDAQLKRRKLAAPKNLAGYVRLICDSLGQGTPMPSAPSRNSVAASSRVSSLSAVARRTPPLQATADASGLPVHAFTLEGTAVGNIASQLIGLRAVKNLKTFREHFAKQIKATIYRPQLKGES